MSDGPARGRGRGGGPLPLDTDLLALLVCPVSRGPLRYDAAKAEVASDAAGLAYPVRDVPVLLPEGARRL